MKNLKWELDEAANGNRWVKDSNGEPLGILQSFSRQSERIIFVSVNNHNALLDLVASLAASLEDANKYIQHKATWDTKGAAVQYSQFGGETIEKSLKMLSKIKGGA